MALPETIFHGIFTNPPGPPPAPMTGVPTVLDDLRPEVLDAPGLPPTPQLKQARVGFRTQLQANLAKWATVQAAEQTRAQDAEVEALEARQAAAAAQADQIRARLATCEQAQKDRDRWLAAITTQIDADQRRYNRQEGNQ